MPTDRVKTKASLVEQGYLDPDTLIAGATATESGAPSASTYDVFGPLMVESGLTSLMGR